MMGHPLTMNEIENVYEINSLRGTHYEQDESSTTTPKRISDR